MKTKNLLPLAFLFLSPLTQAAIETPESAPGRALAAAAKDILVAVIDTGIDQNHPAVQDHLWTNPYEIPDNNIDDDNNGYVDDIHGWNFVDNNNDLTDDHGHGTHISGLILGTAPLKRTRSSAKLMILKYYNPDANGRENLINSLKAMAYAIQMKAKIINYSGGGTERNALERDLILRAESKNILLIAAAGNEHSNSNFRKFYPANYGLSNIISVTALDYQARVLASSNYGDQSVDLAAPGKDLISSLPDNKWGEMTGTSQATAVVTKWAVAVMERSALNLKPAEVIKKLLKAGKKDETLAGKTKHQVRLSLDLSK